MSKKVLGIKIIVGGSGVWNLEGSEIGGVIPKKGRYAPEHNEQNESLIREGIRKQTKAPRKLNGGTIWHIEVLCEMCQRGATHTVVLLSGEMNLCNTHYGEFNPSVEQVW